MPDWDSYKAEAKARGSLALELYVVQSTPAKSPEELRSVLPDHLAYQREREAAGDLMFAGPLSDETGSQMEGMGMLVYRAASLDDARALADADPMHRTGARTFTIRKWMINEGNLMLNIGLSAQSIKLS